MSTSLPASFGIFLLALVILLLAAVGIGALSSSRRIDDLWNDKIAEWQEPTSGRPGKRRPRPAAHRCATRRRGGRSEQSGRARRRDAPGRVRDVPHWTEARARRAGDALGAARVDAAYRDDGPRDDWPTVSETLDGDGDDCDGLELLAYTMLRDLGFGENSVYRAIGAVLASIPCTTW